MPDLRYRVLLADSLDEPGLEVLRRGGCELVDASSEERTHLQERIARCHGLVVRSRTKVDRALLAAAVDLRVIGCSGIGVDNVDIEAATERDIAIVNTPTANVVAAAELTLALILSLARNLMPAVASVVAGEWERRRFRGIELAGKTLGVIGFGRIGRQVAARAAAFGMKVVATDPYLEPEVGRRFTVEFLSLHELLAAADVVTVHTPRTFETRHLIDAERLGWMKPGALLVNCARGGIVDEGAVLASLDAGILAGFGMDVHEQEPPRDLRLVRHPRVVATPHIGAQTEEAQRRVAVEVAERLVAVLDGSRAVDTVNLPARTIDRRLRALRGLADRLGALAGALLGAKPSLEAEEVALVLETRGIEEGLAQALASGALAGFVRAHEEGEASDANAPPLSALGGVSVSHHSTPALAEGEETVTVEVRRSSGPVCVVGSLGPTGEARLMKVGDAAVDAPLAGPLLLVHMSAESSPLAVVLGELERAACELVAVATWQQADGGGRSLLFALKVPAGGEPARSIRALAGVASAVMVPFGGGRKGVTEEGEEA